ncbi:MEDS domain-containing protein [Alkalihalobacterium sp. APHAB7]|uniref:MEDS domain-containing protein n=1 Tax=Alkalihalobacterium sp. APHAB7 TaxID=3402081 RepID=UPI003AAFA12E
MSIATKTIALTENMQVNEGSHILYFYQSEQLYLDNLVSFIVNAIDLNQHAIVIETPKRFESVLQKLTDQISKDQYEIDHL